MGGGRKLVFGGAIVLWGSAMVATSQRPAAPPAAPHTTLVDFAADIRPLITKNCLECHSQDKRKGGLSLATYADILDGGKDGAIVRPGNGAGSMLVQRLTGEIDPQMPKDDPPLSDALISLFRRWIDEGARETPTSPAAPPPWEAPLALERPALPDEIWPGWTSPADRIVAAYLRGHRATGPPSTVSDALFARRAYLDVWGLLPSPEQLNAFLLDRSPARREALVEKLLANDALYAEHWISFWNDLLRNEDGVSYYSEQNGRRSITPWLLSALRSNLPYDRFVADLLNPKPPGGPEGFLVGVNWRGETSAAVTPWMQASQNTAQLFLGVNLKCNSCHNSFVSRWKLKDAYGLAAYFSPDPKLQLFRCDVAQNQYAEPSFLYPELSRAPDSASLADRRAAVAAIFTDRRNGRLPRTLVNRIWQRLLGRGIVANPDEMDGRPWSPELLDWLASDFVEHGYDVKHLIATILASRAYQLPAVSRTTEPPAVGYVFTGPELRRLTAEQFADAIGSITGEWSVSTLNIGGRPAPAPPRAAPGAAMPSDPATLGKYAREWRNISTELTRALGRPIRDQVISVRATEPTTPQALELVNGDLLAHRLLRGARRMLGAQPPEPTSLYNKSVAGRQARPVDFDVEISGASRLWLLVKDQGSNAPDLVRPVWADTELVDADGGVTPLGALTPVRADGLRHDDGPVSVGDKEVAAVRVTGSSELAYDVGGRGFARLRGTMWIENPSADIGSTLDPQLRFFIFSAEPDLDRLRPPAPGAPLPAPPVLSSAAPVIGRIFEQALARRPTVAELAIAERALRDPVHPGRVPSEAVADLLWAVMMKPEFQFIY